MSVIFLCCTGKLDRCTTMVSTEGQSWYRKLQTVMDVCYGQFGDKCVVGLGFLFQIHLAAWELIKNLHDCVPCLDFLAVLLHSQILAINLENTVLLFPMEMMAEAIKMTPEFYVVVEFSCDLLRFQRAIAVLHVSHRFLILTGCDNSCWPSQWLLRRTWDHFHWHAESQNGLGVRGHPGQRQVSEPTTSLTKTNQPALCERTWDSSTIPALLQPSSTVALPDVAPLREGGEA